MDNDDKKCFARLTQENEKIREEIDTLIGLDSPVYSPIWRKINALIENEISQESYCNQ